MMFRRKKRFTCCVGGVKKKVDNTAGLQNDSKLKAKKCTPVYFEIEFNA